MEGKKILSIAVPCYNSAAFMEKCVESLLVGGNDVEILLINDGSRDNTACIADEYARKYPDIIRVVHQDNAGHGGAVNAGIQNASGIYFKVVDSDDYVEASAYKKVLQTLKRLRREETIVDVFINNYIYNKDGALHKKAMRYRGALPENRVLTWKDVSRLRQSQYILMHSVIYRTTLLRDCGLTLPRHTFYVDNLYVYIPLQHVKTMYYLDVDLYFYYIGREGQSVQEDIMIGRIDQQIRVNKLMVDAVDLLSLPDVRQRRYLFNYLGIVTVISSILLIRGGTPEHLAKKDDLWNYIKAKDALLYRQLRRSIYGNVCHLPRGLTVFLYKTANKIFGFN